MLVFAAVALGSNVSLLLLLAVVVDDVVVKVVVLVSKVLLLGVVLELASALVSPDVWLLAEVKVVVLAKIVASCWLLFWDVLFPTVLLVSLLEFRLFPGRSLAALEVAGGSASSSPKELWKDHVNPGVVLAETVTGEAAAPAAAAAAVAAAAAAATGPVVATVVLGAAVVAMDVLLVVVVVVVVEALPRFYKYSIQSILRLKSQSVPVE